MSYALLVELSHGVCQFVSAGHQFGQFAQVDGRQRAILAHLLHQLRSRHLAVPAKEAPRSFSYELSSCLGVGDPQVLFDVALDDQLGQLGAGHVRVVVQRS